MDNSEANVQEQDSNTQAEPQANGQAPEPSETATPSIDPTEYEALRAKAEKYEAELQRARDEAAQRRIKAREEAEAKAKALQEQGEYKALAETQTQTIEELKAQLAEAEALKEKASRFDQWQAAELEKIEERKSSLSDSAKAALDAAPTLEAKRAFLAALDSQGPSARVSQNAGGGSAPAGNQVDFDSLKGRALTEAIKKDPAAYWAKHGVKQGGQPGSIIGRMLASKG